jgi:hypothetical protein
VTIFIEQFSLLNDILSRIVTFVAPNHVLFVTYNNLTFGVLFIVFQHALALAISSTKMFQSCETCPKIVWRIWFDLWIFLVNFGTTSGLIIVLECL